MASLKRLAIKLPAKAAPAQAPTRLAETPAKGSKAAKAKKQDTRTPAEKIRAKYEKSHKTLKDLGKKGQLTAQEIKGAELDMSGVNELKSMATTPSQDSAWLKMASDSQKLDEASDLDSAAKAAAQAGSSAQARLAMGGGLRSGAAERLSAQAGEGELLAQQGVRSAGARTRAGLGMEAEQNRLKALSQLPGAQLGVAEYGTGIERFNSAARTGANQGNVANAVRDMENRNSFNKDLYTGDMTQDAMNQQADAVKNGQGQGLMDQFGKLNPLGGAGAQASLANSAVAGVTVPYAAANKLTGGKLPSVGGGGGGKIICTEYCRQGWISDEVLRGDLEYAAKYLTRDERANYLIWAQYVVPILARYPILLYLGWPITYNWVHYMAWKMGRYDHKPLFGPFVQWFATHVSNVLGRTVRRMKRRRFAV